MIFVTAGEAAPLPNPDPAMRWAACVLPHDPAHLPPSSPIMVLAKHRK